MSETVKSISGNINTRALINIRFFTDIPFTEENEITSWDFGLTEAGVTYEDFPIIYLMNDSDHTIYNAKIMSVYDSMQVGSYRDTMEQCYFASSNNGLLPNDTLENAFLICGVGTGASGANGGTIKGGGYTKFTVVLSPDHSTSSGYKLWNVKVLANYYPSNREYKSLNGNLHINITGYSKIAGGMYTLGGYETIRGYLNTIGGS